MLPIGHMSEHDDEYIERLEKYFVRQYFVTGDLHES